VIFISTFVKPTTTTNMKANEREKLVGQLLQISLGDIVKFREIVSSVNNVEANGYLSYSEFLHLVNAGWNPMREIKKIIGGDEASLKYHLVMDRITFKALLDAINIATTGDGLYAKVKVLLSDELQDFINNFVWDKGEYAEVTEIVEYKPLDKQYCKDIRERTYRVTKSELEDLCSKYDLIELYRFGATWFKRKSCFFLETKTYIIGLLKFDPKNDNNQ
jgi:hypothetical protein